MTTIVTRSGKGSPLTWAELDANFTNLNAAKLELDGSGRLLVGVTATGDAKIQVDNGVRFGATLSADANTLDYYQEGSFTPTIVGTTTAGTGTYTVQLGRYTRIGNRVLFSAYITWTAHTGTGNMRISGLPFTVAGNTIPCAVYASDLSFTGQLQAVAVTGGTQIYVRQVSGGGTFSEVAMDAAATLNISGHYEV